MNNKLRILSLFSGIGAFEKALTRQNIPYELVAFAEIDKYAIKSYCAIHNVDEKLNLGDVSKVDYSNIHNIDLIVGGSPCQDFSIAGKQNGAMWTCKDCGEQYNPIQQHYSKRKHCVKCGSENLEKTRSSLLVEYLRSIRELKPKYFVYENVKNIIGKQFKEMFNLFENELKEYGYNVYYKVLNSKDYGVPQNRERVFVVGVRNDVDNKTFRFPQGFDNGIRLKHILEEKIEDKYYLSEEVQSRFKFNDKQHENIIGTTKPEYRTIGQRDLVYGTDGVMGCLVVTDYKQPKQIIEGFTINYGEIKLRRDGVGTCLDTRYGSFPDNHGARTGIIEFNEINVIGELDIKGQDCIKRVYDKDGISPTLTTMEGGNRQPKIINKDFKIRKLTPLECFRLMGFDDQDFENAQKIGTSDTQIYKQAGNSIVVNVLEYIFKNLFK